jgi:hypothetical protein
MNNAFTNQSVHTRIDREFLQNSEDPIGGTSYSVRGEEAYISPQEKVDRLSHKIDQMKGGSLCFLGRVL